MLGGSYALVAIGYTLIFGVLNLLHLAHGEVAMIGAYVGFPLVLTAMSQMGVLPIWVVLLGAMIGAGIMGIIVELVAFRPLGRRQLHITPLITTIAVGFVLQEAAVKIFGSEQCGLPIQMLASSACSCCFFYRLRHSRFGRAMMAIKDDELVAHALGIHVARIKRMAFATCAAMAGVGGGLYAHYALYIQYSDFGADKAMSIMTYAIFGGIDFWCGGVLGAAMLSYMPVL